MRNADFRKCRQISSSWLLLAKVTLMTLGLTLTRAARSREELLARPADALLLEQHNIFRQEEKAANILKMHWNDSAAVAAERWARGCDFRHEMAGTFGENLYYGSADPKEEKETLLSGLERWHDEKRGWRYSSDMCGSACHYTQMVWSSTNSVGCAYNRCRQLNVFGRKADNVLFLVCYYYPRGNWVGEYPFQMGAPCSRCGSGICQEGLCVEVTSYRSYQGNEVRAGTEWRWQYDSDANQQGSNSSSSSHRHVAAGTGYDHRRQRHDDNSASLSRQHGAQHVSHSSARLGAQQHNVTRVEAHHTAEEHDVRRGADGSYGSSYRSASYYRASSQHSLQPAPDRHQQAWEGEATSGSRETILRDLENFTPSRKLRKELEAGTPQALYAAPPPEHYEGRTRDVTSHVVSDDVWSQRRVENGYRPRSPLDILRAETHWCRDRLPSCTAWAKQCITSKAVLMACPSSCGQCGKLQQTNELPHHDARQKELRSRPGGEREKGAEDRRVHHQPAGLEGQREARVTAGAGQLRSVGRAPDHRQQQHDGRTRTDPHPRREEGGPERGQEGRGRRDEPEKARLTDENRRRRHQQRLERRLQRQKEAEEKRRQRDDRRRQREEKRRLWEERRGAGGQQQQQLWIHRKFRTADKRAQKLAAYLRRNTVNGELCEDDPKYAKTCSQWVARGFCTSNELLRNIYCKLSCGMCSPNRIK